MNQAEIFRPQPTNLEATPSIRQLLPMNEAGVVVSRIEARAGSVANYAEPLNKHQKINLITSLVGGELPENPSDDQLIAAVVTGIHHYPEPERILRDLRHHAPNLLATADNFLSPAYADACYQLPVLSRSMKDIQLTNPQLANTLKGTHEKKLNNIRDASLHLCRLDSVNLVEDIFEESEQLTPLAQQYQRHLSLRSQLAEAWASASAKDKTTILDLVWNGADAGTQYLSAADIKEQLEALDLDPAAEAQLLNLAKKFVGSAVTAAKIMDAGADSDDSHNLPNDLVADVAKFDEGYLTLLNTDRDLLKAMVAEDVYVLYDLQAHGALHSSEKVAKLLLTQVKDLEIRNAARLLIWKGLASDTRDRHYDSPYLKAVKARVKTINAQITATGLRDSEIFQGLAQGKPEFGMLDEQFELLADDLLNLSADRLRTSKEKSPFTHLDREDRYLARGAQAAKHFNAVVTMSSEKLRTDHLKILQTTYGMIQPQLAQLEEIDAESRAKSTEFSTLFYRGFSEEVRNQASGANAAKAYLDVIGVKQLDPLELANDAANLNEILTSLSDLTALKTQLKEFFGSDQDRFAAVLGNIFANTLNTSSENEVDGRLFQSVADQLIGLGIVPLDFPSYVSHSSIDSPGYHMVDGEMCEPCGESVDKEAEAALEDAIIDLAAEQAGLIGINVVVNSPAGNLAMWSPPLPQVTDPVQESPNSKVETYTGGFTPTASPSGITVSNRGDTDTAKAVSLPVTRSSLSSEMASDSSKQESSTAKPTQPEDKSPNIVQFKTKLKGIGTRAKQIPTSDENSNPKTNLVDTTPDISSDFKYKSRSGAGADSPANPLDTRFNVESNVSNSVSQTSTDAVGKVTSLSEAFQIADQKSRRVSQQSTQAGVVQAKNTTAAAVTKKENRKFIDEEYLPKPSAVQNSGAQTAQPAKRQARKAGRVKKTPVKKQVISTASSISADGLPAEVKRLNRIEATQPSGHLRTQAQIGLLPPGQDSAFDPFIHSREMQNLVYDLSAAAQQAA